MFIYCYDEKLKRELLAKGFKLIKIDGQTSVFAMNKSIKFSEIEKNKIIISNKLDF